jgi:hypothetical protein
MTRIKCARCEDENGPFSRQPEGPVCEDCLDAQDGKQ